MYKKYITNKTSYTKMRKNNLTSTNPPPPLPPPPLPTKQNIIITQTHTLSYSNQNNQLNYYVCTNIYIQVSTDSAKYNILLYLTNYTCWTYSGD